LLKQGGLYTVLGQVMRELYFQYFKVELERRNQITISSRAMLSAWVMVTDGKTVVVKL